MSLAPHPDFVERISVGIRVGVTIAVAAVAAWREVTEVGNLVMFRSGQLAGEGPHAEFLQRGAT